MTNVKKWVSYRQWEVIYTALTHQYTSEEDVFRTMILMWADRNRNFGYGYNHRARSYLNALGHLMEHKGYTREKTQELLDETIDPYTTTLNDFRRKFNDEEHAKYMRNKGLED